MLFRDRVVYYMYHEIRTEHTMKHVKYAKCVKCGRTYDALPTLTSCACGGILDIVYDYEYIKASLTKEILASRRDNSMWRYRELLPIEETTQPTPLRVGWSPLYQADALAEQLGISRLYIKDDGINPTASLKDRASAMAVAKAREAGAKVIACSSTGNAASSLAGNAAAAGLKTYIFVPSRAPKGKVAQLMTFGATVISVQGSYEETFELSKRAIERWGWYNRNAAINPYLSEGKKTVALEIMEQLDWLVPDYIAISVGDGCTIAGLWKGLKDLYASAPPDFRSGGGLLSPEPGRRNRGTLAAHGGEYPGGLHRGWRSPERGQGAYGDSGIKGPYGQRDGPGDYVGAETPGTYLRRFWRTGGNRRYSGTEKAY